MRQGCVACGALTCAACAVLEGSAQASRRIATLRQGKGRSTGPCVAPKRWPVAREAMAELVIYGRDTCGMCCLAASDYEVSA